MFSSVALPSLLSEWLPFMLLGWSLFGVLGTLALGLGRSGKVDESVYCYWIAAAIALVFGVLAAGYYWAHGDLYGDLYAIVLLLVGALFTLLFLAVGNVYAFNARGK
jgi:fatty acid desaturase